MICLVIWAIGVRLLRRQAASDRLGSGWPGSTALPILGLLAIERFLVEILRAKDDRFLGPFTLAQAISLLVLLVASGLWFSRRRRPRMPAAPQQA